MGISKCHRNITISILPCNDIKNSWGYHISNFRWHELQESPTTHLTNHLYYLNIRTYLLKTKNRNGRYKSPPFPILVVFIILMKSGLIHFFIIPSKFNVRERALLPIVRNFYDAFSIKLLPQSNVMSTIQFISF